MLTLTNKLKQLMSDKHFDDKLYVAKKFMIIVQILDGRIFEDQNIFI